MTWVVSFRSRRTITASLGLTAALLLSVQDPLFGEAVLSGDLPRTAALGFRARSAGPDGPLVIERLDGDAVAAAAGVREGDAVLSVNGHSFASTREGLELLRRLPGDNPVSLGLQRKERKLTLSFTPSPVPLENIPGVTSFYDVLETRDGSKLRTIVTRPQNAKGRLPALLFVQWLSCDSIELPHNVDDGWQRMLRMLASRSGMVMMRTDKAGIGDSLGVPCYELDYETEVAHQRAALAKLRALEYVDPDRIIVFGASMGGNLAPLVALDQEIAGIIIWGTVVKTWFEHLMEFNRRALELGGTSPVAVTRAMNRLIPFLTEYLVRGRTPDQIRLEDPELGGIWSEIVGTDGDTHYGRPTSFHQQAHSQDWIGAWDQVRVPFLALYGEYDWFEQMDDHALAVRIVNRNTPGSARLVVIPRMNHHFSIFETLQDAFNSEREIISPEPAVVEILAWLREHFDKGT